MARRFDASADALSRTTTIPGLGCTLMGWFYASADRNAGANCLAWGAASGSSYAQFAFDHTGAATDLFIWDGNSTHTSTGSGPLTTWMHLALVIPSSYGGACLGYKDGSLLITASDIPNAVTASKIYVGNDNDAEFLNGRAAAIKIYSAILTATEIAHEMRYSTPQRIANLNTWSPLLNDDSEQSGVGGAWTVGGTLATEDGPPILWAPRQSRRVFTFTAGGGADVTFAASLSADATLAGNVNVDRPLIANLSATADIVAIAKVDRGIIVPFQADANLAAAVNVDRRIQAALQADANLAGSINADRNVSASLSATSDLAAFLKCDRPLIASLAGDANLTAVLTTGTERTFAANVTGDANLTVVLKVDRRIQAALQADANLTADLAIQGQKTFAANCLVTSDLAAMLKVDRPLAANLQALATLTAVLMRDRNFAAALMADANVAAVVKVDRGIMALVQADATLAAILRCDRKLLAALAASADLACAMTVSSFVTYQPGMRPTWVPEERKTLAPRGNLPLTPGASDVWKP